MIDKTVHKAFIQGINGCVEHNVAMEEMIRHAKLKRKTLHIAFFDLADVFGSVPHELLYHEMKRAHVPRQIQCYVEKFYDNLESQVVTKNYKSCLFSFKRGVMTGDPMSPICFQLAFQPILSFLKNEEEKYGYDL